MNFITPERLKTYTRVIVAVYLAAHLYWIFAGPGLVHPDGKSKGGDFVAFYAASQLARSGQAAAVYDFPSFQAEQESVVGQTLAHMPWPYPPTCLLLLLPLAALPYLPALLVWIAGTLAGYACIVRRIAPHPLTVWLLLAFPGTFANWINGHNGFFSGLLLGGGLLLLNSAPAAGGFILGLMVYKPQLCWLIPVALLAGRSWRALVGFAAGAAVLIGSSALWLGLEVWQAYFDSFPGFVQALETAGIRYMKMPSVFAAIIYMTGSFALAKVLQTLTTLMMLALVCWAWSRKAPPPLKAATLVLALLLATPYVWDHDLALLALPLAWLGWEAYRSSWLAGEKVILLVVWIFPLLYQPLAYCAGLQLGVLAPMLLLYVAARRLSHLSLKRV